MRLVVADGLILAGWLASVGLVVLEGRGSLAGGARNPARSLGATLEAKEQWFDLSYQGQKIGFSHAMLVPEERNGMPGVGVIDQGQLTFTLLGAPQRLHVSARAFIDADWRLQEFDASLQAPAYHLQWVGRRLGEKLVMTVRTPESSITKALSDPTGGTFVTGLSSWAAFLRLRVGQSGRVWLLNPMALTPEPLYFTVRRMEPLDGREALVIETDVAGLSTTSWVTPDGEVLRETSPLGWELRRVSREEALTGQPDAASAPDLLSAMSVPIDRRLDEPARIATLTLLVEGVEGEELALARPWQRVLPPERLAEYARSAPSGPWCLVQLEAPKVPETSGGQAAGPPAVERWRRPSLFVQSDDPRIVAKAAEIVGSRADPWEQAVALNRWVFSTLTKRLSVGLPSAVDVLLTLAGDCHEHTVLFTALARSLALPTRMVAGLVYWQDRLYYHAWPEVWIGQWIPTDPTLGQPVADATHLGLLEAENEQLIALSQFLGKLRVQVVEVVEQ
jgi:transglutaminase-like putative cysteine protease